jgi:hypothetical protein
MSTSTEKQSVRDERYYRLSKDWIRYRGPFGGEGWQNVETGDVRYVDEPPGEVATEDQTQTTLPGEGFELPVDISKPKWIDEVGTVAEIVQDTILPPVNSDSNPRLEITDLWNDGDYEHTVEGFLEATADWIKENGDNRDAARFQEALQQHDGMSPWGEVEADVPDHLNPEKAEEITPLFETEAKGGISAESMMVAEMEHGDRVFLTNVNPDVAGDIGASSGWDALAAEQSSKFLDELGVEVPEHEYVEGEYLAVEEAKGMAIGETMGRVRVSKGEFTSFAATQLLVGNTDGHSHNVFYGYGGLEPIDLDLAGTDFEEQPREVAWALGKLFDTAVEAGIYPPYSDESKEEFVDDIRAEVQGWANSDTVEDALEAVENDALRDRFRTNIELAREGELLDENQEVKAGL